MTHTQKLNQSNCPDYPAALRLSRMVALALGFSASVVSMPSALAAEDSANAAIYDGAYFGERIMYTHVALKSDNGKSHGDNAGLDIDLGYGRLLAPQLYLGAQLEFRPVSMKVSDTGNKVRRSMGGSLVVGTPWQLPSGLGAFSGKPALAFAKLGWEELKTNMQGPFDRFTGPTGGLGLRIAFVDNFWVTGEIGMARAKETGNNQTVKENALRVGLGGQWMFKGF
jgi:hypothetical protein